VTLVDITVLGRHLAGHDVPDQIHQARAIGTAQAAADLNRQGQAPAAPVIAAMQAQIRQLGDAGTDQAAHGRPAGPAARPAPGLSEAEQVETAATVHRILRKILHRPTVRAKEFTAGPQGPVYLEALRQLFGPNA
jgi:glutamyl-tRNA reductase